MYKYKTIIYDCNGRSYYRKHKTENQTKKYIKEMNEKGNLEIVFVYQIKDTDNRFPFIWRRNP